MFRNTVTVTEFNTEELELSLETLKDLTVSGRQAQDVKGGITTGAGGGANCYCGTW